MPNDQNRIILFIIVISVLTIAYINYLDTNTYNSLSSKISLNQLLVKPSQDLVEYIYPGVEQNESEVFTKKSITYPLTFIVYGDSRETSGEVKEYLLKQILDEQPNLFIHLGDLVLWGEEHQWKIFDLFHKDILKSKIPFYPVLGNHEYHTKDVDWPINPEKQLKSYFLRFPLLENRRWYSLRYGDILFINLDTNTDYTEGSFQYNWLIDKLKNEKAKYLFVSYHHPSYSSNKKYSRPNEKFLAQVFESYQKEGYLKPDIIFSGHVHDYEVNEHNKIKYVVSGGGGAELHGSSKNHYLKVAVYPDSIEVKKISYKNKENWIIEDSFVINKE